MDSAKKANARGKTPPDTSAKPPLPNQTGPDDGEQDDHKGLRCPQCNCGHFETEWTRPMCANKIRRRRRCRYCGHVIFTQEKADG